MTRYFTLIFCIIFCLHSYAKDENKYYKKIIEVYDVPDTAKNVIPNNPTDFWHATLNNNYLLHQFIKNLKKNKGAEKEALSKAANLPRFYPQYDESIMTSMQGFCDTLLIDAGIAQLNIKCSLHVIYSDEVNAFTALTEDGFAICLTSALLQRRGITYEILLGYVAHEFVHGALFHHARGFYAEAKERRKNELLAGIAVGLNAIAAGANAYTSSMYGVEYDNSQYYRNIENVNYEAKTSTLKYKFKYSREQEYECDLIAFRFLENLNCGEEFLNGLRILGTQYDDLYSDYSDHPTITSRINFLKYVQNNPALGNKKKKGVKHSKEVVDEIYDDD